MRGMWAFLLTLCSTTIARANVLVCVDVQVKSWAANPVSASAGDLHSTAEGAKNSLAPLASAIQNLPPETAPAAVEPKRDPYLLDPAAYLKRLLEYEVTHAEGYAAVQSRCSEHMTVELYTLESGWTVFARFSRTAREEKVDRVDLDEFEALAQRVASALLQDRSIVETLNRENVLRDDSAHALRRVHGQSHATFAMGTAVRVGELPTARDPEQPVQEEIRVLTPFDVHLGYRLNLRAWALDAFARMSFGTNTTALRSNESGGHVDYAGGGALGLHFIRYFSATGVNSPYAGAGAALELSLFDVIRAREERESDNRAWLYGGGLDIELFLGQEFLRASAVHFFAEIAAIVPTYLFNSENSAGRLHTYFPGGLVQVGTIL